MRSIVIISAICMQMGWSQGNPYPGSSKGVGAFAYQDSTGNRYGGTYGLKDGEIFNTGGDDFASFNNFQPANFHDLDDFFPDYFRNFENLLQETFQNHLESQKLALDAARKAFDLTSNQAGYIPNFASRSAPPAFPDFFTNMPYSGSNNAFAAAQVGPGFSHQMASINPVNPNMPNVDVTSFSDPQTPGQGKFFSVSSSSYASSSNVNGQQSNQRGSETVVNNNGKVTAYKVHN